MPLAIAFGAGVAAGLWACGSASEIANAAKWIAIAGLAGGALFIGAKATKVI